MFAHRLTALRAPALAAALLLLSAATAAAQPGPGGGFYQGRYYPSRYGYGITARGYTGYPTPGVGVDFALYGDPASYPYPPMFLYAHTETVLYPAPPGGATVEVKAPADAEVWFDDEPTRQRGEFRRFVSPPLAPGKEFHYEVRARWKEGDRVVDQTRTIGVRAGQTTEVEFNRPEQAPAPKEIPPGK